MRRILLAVATIVYLSLLLWAYQAIISPAFDYYGYQLNWPGNWSIAWVYAMALAPQVFLPMQVRRPSGLIAWWLYYTIYLPSLLLPFISLTLGAEVLLPLDATMMACMLLLCAVGSAPVLALPRFFAPEQKFWMFVFAAWAAALVFVCAHFSLTGMLTNLASLFFGGSEYTIRATFFDQLSQTGRVLGYTTGQVGEGLDPFFIAYGMVHKRRGLVACGIVGQLVLFAVLGAKSILFSSAFIVLVYFMLRRYRRNFGMALSGLLIAVVLISAAVDIATDSVLLSSISTRRTLMDPGLLTGFYYEHYLETSHAGLAYHFPKEGEAVPAPSYEIGLVYFGDEHIDANANLWAEGFADFGLPGVVGFTAILMAMMWVYDSVAACQDRMLGLLVLAMQAFSFSNAAPLTTLITHGGLLSLLLLWMAPTLNSPAPEAEPNHNTMLAAGMPVAAGA